ncbi:MAG: hypothetical protein ACOX4O_00235 [Eubacteriales bacterium]|jgi:hypothetical protein
MQNEISLNTAEHRVRKKVQGKYRWQRIGVRAGLIAFLFIPFLLSMIKIGDIQFTFMLWTIPLFVFVDGFILRHLFRYVDIEYEYTVVSGELRVDIIYGNARRKEWVAKKFADMTAIAPYKDQYKAAAEDSSINNVYDATSSTDSPDCYYCLFNDENDDKCVLFFEATTKILKQAKLFNVITVLSEVTY